MMTRLRELWELMGTSQKVLFASLSGAVLLTLIVFFTWLGREDFTLLYSNMAPEESARIIEILQKRNVDYRVTMSGNGIMVPAARVGELKVMMAGEGLPTGGVTGYEIFDGQGLGVSEFTQNINYRRALEGELSRSISSISAVEKARVHLVIPKQALFRDEQQQPSASVILNLIRPGALRAEQVQAVQRLVSGSVEGLNPEHVTLLDSFGTLLSREGGSDVAGLSSAQLEIKQEVESYLGRKAQSTLESALGMGTALVRVNADLDFERVERTREVVDPETSAVLSEQRNQSTNEGDGEVTESSTVNYEFNRMVESIIGSTGSVKKLMVAVMIDGVYSTDDAGEVSYAPRNAQELEGYRKIVENIVGLSKERGDKIEMLNVRFQEPVIPEPGGMAGILDSVPSLLNKVLVVLALLFLLGTFRKLSGQLVSGLPTGRVAGGDASGGTNRSGGSGGSAASMIGEKAGRGLEVEEQARALALDKPEEIAQLVRTWMHARS